MSSFRALRVHLMDGKTQPRLEALTVDQLSSGEVVIEVHHSSINYKDALAVTGKGKILRRFPLNPGIDAGGIVQSSSDLNFKPGQKVLVTGCGIGENEDGGYSEILRVKASSVIPLPEGLTLRESMILGTAGFTAALALFRMERNGQHPDMGPIVITGASGGVGTFAVEIFSQAGYEVHALSGKPQAHEQLKKLGAHKVITPEEFNEIGKHPLESVRYGGAVDNIGGSALARILASTQLWGNVASIGLAESAELHTTVMPFILRGVSLLGVSSNNTDLATRHHLWKQLAGRWKPVHLEDIVARVVKLEDVVAASHDLLARRIQGRMIVEVK